MNAVFAFSLVVGMATFLCGCTNMKAKPVRCSSAEVRHLFYRVMADCQKAGQDGTSLSSIWRPTYWLPQSVEQLIKCGTNAVPVLTELGRSSDFNERQLAIICLDVIQAPNLEKGGRRTDARSGVAFVSITVLR